MRNFWFHHQVIYRRTLWAGMLVMLVMGLIDTRTKFFSQSLSLLGTKAIIAGISFTTLQTPIPPVTAAAAPVATAVVTTVSEAKADLTDYSEAGDMRSLGRKLNAAKFGDDQWPALNALWTHESNWRPGARNRHSGACGIPQALPCAKIPDMSPTGQISWGLDYIAARYGSPANAWAFWQSHHWY